MRHAAISLVMGGALVVEGGGCQEAMDAFWGGFQIGQELAAQMVEGWEDDCGYEDDVFYQDDCTGYDDWYVW